MPKIQRSRIFSILSILTKDFPNLTPIEETENAYFNKLTKNKTEKVKLKKRG